jgi:cytochrome b pre-mRNA-processing protein 3
VPRSHQRQDHGGHAAERLYAACVERARARAFYASLKVPDTLDGRFDLVALHASLVLEALKRAGLSDELGSQFVTLVFAGFEEALRELGVGDFGLTRRIKNMADAFYGRLDAYTQAMDDEASLQSAILRNVYRGDEARQSDAGALARYVLAARNCAKASDAVASLRAGQMDFGPPPES